MKQTDKTDIKSLKYADLAAFFASNGFPKYKTEQIFAWLHKGASSTEEMTDISKTDREKLNAIAYITTPVIEKKLISKLDGTVKYLWRLSENEYVESVVMEYKHGLSICVSTQLGCKMGCVFCASTVTGFQRDLTAAEILDQIIFASKDIGKRISNVVLMGIGEPLNNFENVMTFLENVNNEKGLNIGYRHISLSTCGIGEKIEQLLEKNIPLTLSISLHAPNDEIRNRIMPVNKVTNTENLLIICEKYAKITKRRISIEYILIEGMNDKRENAEELANRLRQIRLNTKCHVNLIPVNVINEKGFNPPSNNAIKVFESELIKNGINATTRRTLGADIQASCGQLRAKSTE